MDRRPQLCRIRWTTPCFVLHEAVVEVVTAEGELSWMGASVVVLGDGKSVQGCQQYRVTHIGQPGDLTCRKLLAGVKLLQKGPIPQAGQGGKRDAALDQGRESWSAVRLV